MIEKRERETETERQNKTGVKMLRSNPPEKRADTVKLLWILV